MIHRIRNSGAERVVWWNEFLHVRNTTFIISSSPSSSSSSKLLYLKPEKNTFFCTYVYALLFHITIRIDWKITSASGSKFTRSSESHTALIFRLNVLVYVPLILPNPFHRLTASKSQMFLISSFFLSLRLGLGLSLKQYYYNHVIDLRNSMLLCIILPFFKRRKQVSTLVSRDLYGSCTI